MRHLLVVAALFVGSTACAQSSLPTADQVFKTALQQASSQKKKVLLITHASWCGWCRKMDTSLSDPSIKDYFDKNFVTTHLTAYESKGKEHLENPGAVAFLAPYGGQDAGLPYWIIFDATGKVLADSRMKYPGKEELSNTGCPASAEEVANFIQVLKKTTDLDENELHKIATRFRKNEQK
jgi:thioredoxin-related protein